MGSRSDKRPAKEEHRIRCGPRSCACAELKTHAGATRRARCVHVALRSGLAIVSSLPTRSLNLMQAGRPNDAQCAPRSPQQQIGNKASTLRYHRWTGFRTCPAFIGRDIHDEAKGSEIRAVETSSFPQTGRRVPGYHGRHGSRPRLRMRGARVRNPVALGRG